MPALDTKLSPSLPNLFYAGLAMVMLVYWLSFIPDWLTFVHLWKVELFASVVLLATLAFAYRHSADLALEKIISRDEVRFVVLPLVAFIIWSGASVIWATSWKSAIHHTLVWTLYLIFYGLVRYSLNQHGHYRKFLFVFAGSLVMSALPAVAGYAAVTVFGGTNTLGIRFSRFGEQVVVVLPLVILAVVKLRSKGFAVGLAVVSMLWLLVFCSMSRAGILLSTTATLLTGTMLFLNPRCRGYRLKFAAILIALIASPVFLLGSSLFSVTDISAPIARFSDQEGLSNSNDFRKLMTSLSLHMFANNPITGIGADNFGFEAHRYRESYARENPGDPHLAQAESTLPERSHNEYLQILAETGIVGVAIFSWFLFGIAVMAVRTAKNFRKLPPIVPAAVTGLIMFLAAGLVTSYSFRLLQNGFVFFFVLAVASKLLSVRGRVGEPREPSTVRPIQTRLVLAGGIVACVTLLAYSAIRVSSVIVTGAANSTANLQSAEELYSLAARLDDENPFAVNDRAHRLLREERFAESAFYFARSIEMGHATSETFSYLATVQSLSGSNAAAERTMARAASLYPWSVFVLVRYSILQDENRKYVDSAATLARAEKISQRATRTWHTMISQGFRIASSKEASDRYGLIPVMDLQPQGGIYAVLTERLIKHPEEQRFSLFRPVNARTADPEPRHYRP